MSHLLLFQKTLWCCCLKSQCWRTGMFATLRINPFPFCCSGSAGAAGSAARAFTQPSRASSVERRVSTTVTPCTAASPSPLSSACWRDRTKDVGFPHQALAPFACTERSCSCMLRLLSAGLSHFVLLWGFLTAFAKQSWKRETYQNELFWSLVYLCHKGFWRCLWSFVLESSVEKEGGGREAGASRGEGAFMSCDVP